MFTREAFVKMKSWVLLGSMMLSPLSLAADIPGSLDLPGVERPLGSEIVRYSEGVQSAIRLPLERVERVNNRLVIDEELDINGHVVDITYELGASEEYEPFMAALKTKMTEQDAEILFSCESRGCGMSGLWANTLFKVRELYGPDGTQIYFAVELTGEVSRYLSAYGIERGNRRQYVHIRMIEPDINQSQFKSAQELLSDGRMILPVEFAGNRVSPESRAALREMASRLQSVNVAELAIVAYRPVTPGGTLANAITESNARAIHVQALLEEAGLTINHAQGMGPLVAPGGLSPDRVEIVKFR